MDSVPFTHCPTNKKNCVSSIDLTPYHSITPLPFSGDVEETRGKIMGILEQFEDVEIKESERQYIHAVFTSKWFKFKDDLEIFLDVSMGLVHIKSGSRLGYYDFKVNRKRVERIKSMYQQ
ncbi:DUF1499 domain-containing protein [Bacillus sp. KH172YL63]|uniref:DUF1499 domain-containing protein n=1 Tax=Bacillus sp. KH172YL63 TaxID=2709784 RepID=UPI0013E47DC1|nr:DUF1499 domain-containing protein [Bacillus sp. KH172YL63]BCB04840.1 hypothetical protein KH172YL63_29730 [Bacillus sp. KH172YL63]